MGQIPRRQFLIATGALLASRLACAQTPAPDRSRTVGVLVFESDPKRPAGYLTSNVMRKLGWIEGKNLVIEHRFADLKAERLAGLVEELIRKRVEVLHTVGSPATLAAARATGTIPIVFAGVPFPVEQGLVDSLAQPGRNITGTTVQSGIGLTQKHLEFLREIAPAAKRVYRLAAQAYTETITGGRYDFTQSMTLAAKQLGLELRIHPIDKIQDIEAALSSALAWGAQAIHTSGGSIIGSTRQRIAEFALHNRLPSVFASIANVEAGGLLSYGVTLAESLAMRVRSIEYVDRILRGARPANLPVNQPRSYELVINLRTAKALGLKIPQSILLRADRVIE